MKIVPLALRMLTREWRAGELRVLGLAVLIAVAALASVDGFSSRMRLALAQESNRLLGADLVVVSDQAPANRLIAKRSKRFRYRANRIVPEHGDGGPQELIWPKSRQ